MCAAVTTQEIAEISTGSPALAGLPAVRERISAALAVTALEQLAAELVPQLSGGKLLRAKLTLRMGAATGVPSPVAIDVASAVEIIHAASLFHDDVLDGGLLRRGSPTLWTRHGVKIAVLAGDLLLSQAFRMIQNAAPARVRELLPVVFDMCDAETEQELLIAAAGDTWADCEVIARRKTGGLFGFAAACCPPTEPVLAEALRNAGCRLGTAYQLADDIHDFSDDNDSDKTLGTDAASMKLTAASATDGLDKSLGSIQALIGSATPLLDRWPAARTALQDYLDHDIAPAIETMTRHFRFGAAQ
jgi:geranylgeranyl pyrophosphate synthase